MALYWRRNQSPHSQPSIDRSHSAAHNSGVSTFDDHLMQVGQRNPVFVEQQMHFPCCSCPSPVHPSLCPAQMQQHTLRRNNETDFKEKKWWWRHGEAFLMVIISFFFADCTCADSYCTVRQILCLLRRKRHYHPPLSASPSRSSRFCRCICSDLFSPSNLLMIHVLGFLPPPSFSKPSEVRGTGRINDWSSGEKNAIYHNVDEA